MSVQAMLMALEYTYLKPVDSVQMLGSSVSARGARGCTDKLN